VRPLDLSALGVEAHGLVSELYPLCRSITGDGYRETLRRLQRVAPIALSEVPSGTPVLDWTVPREWNIRDAYVKNSRGERVIDFREHSLHVVSYSVPVRATMSLAELRPHLHSLPEQPDLIPYRTSYYREAWGFCLAHHVLEALPEDSYEVCIDSTLADGSLTYGEVILPGRQVEEILISCHCCHPSLANDNLSAMAIAALLARAIAGRTPEYSYRFLFIPGTIGSITWLATHEADVARIRHGVVLSCLGDAGRLTYKRSRRGSSAVDRAAAHVLAQGGRAHELLDFIPYGYDERQYCSPGYDLPVGCLTRTPNGRFPEYHTSADNLDFVRPEYLADSLRALVTILDVLEHDTTYFNLSPKGEPQLGRRGLYDGLGSQHHPPGLEMAQLWVLNQSDGSHSLLDIAERSGMEFELIRRAADRLAAANLLARSD
jgi:aminopeptidase-like protein